MNPRNEETSASRFACYVVGLASVLGHADRIGPLRDYCTGLILPGERKSVEPMAAKTAPAPTAAQHQSLLHFVGIASWSDEKVLAKVREMVLPSMERHGPIKACVITDTGCPTQRNPPHLPVAYGLYLPKEWTKDKARRAKPGVPSDISFKTKPEIALEQIRWACAAGLPRGGALMDAAYGVDF